MSPRPRRQEQQNNLPGMIRDTAWSQIAEAGAAALSLRAIARELGITAPAIYNYYPNRDALVTALIIDAYASFGEAQLAARNSAPEGDLPARLRATGRAYRDWALAYPQRYQLIFGTPIPGYHAPVEQVLPVAARSLGAIVSVVDALRAANRLNACEFPAVHSEYQPALEVWRKFGGDFHILSISVALLIWARVHGLVSLELAGNMPPFGPQGGDLYEYEIQSIEKQFILA